jgi:hypothetical protein
LFGLGINAETVVETNISDMCTININIIQKSHSIEEKEIKNLENQLSKQREAFWEGRNLCVTVLCLNISTKQSNIFSSFCVI